MLRDCSRCYDRLQDVWLVCIGGGLQCSSSRESISHGRQANTHAAHAHTHARSDRLGRPCEQPQNAQDAQQVRQAGGKRAAATHSSCSRKKQLLLLPCGVVCGCCACCASRSRGRPHLLPAVGSQQVGAALVHVQQDAADAGDQHAACRTVVARLGGFPGHAGCYLLADCLPGGCVHGLVLLVLALGAREGHDLVYCLICSIERVLRKEKDQNSRQELELGAVLG